MATFGTNFIRWNSGHPRTSIGSSGLLVCNSDVFTIILFPLIESKYDCPFFLPILSDSPLFFFFNEARFTFNDSGSFAVWTASCFCHSVLCDSDPWLLCAKIHSFTISWRWSISKRGLGESHQSESKSF